MKMHYISRALEMNLLSFFRSQPKSRPTFKTIVFEHMTNIHFYLTCVLFRLIRITIHTYNSSFEAFDFFFLSPLPLRMTFQTKEQNILHIVETNCESALKKITNL